jgi:hypothetical protein
MNNLSTPKCIFCNAEMKKSERIQNKEAPYINTLICKRDDCLSTFEITLHLAETRAKWSSYDELLTYVCKEVKAIKKHYDDQKAIDENYIKLNRHGQQVYDKKNYQENLKTPQGNNLQVAPPVSNDDAEFNDINLIIPLNESEYENINLCLPSKNPISLLTPLGEDEDENINKILPSHEKQIFWDWYEAHKYPFYKFN